MYFGKKVKFDEYMRAKQRKILRIVYLRIYIVGLKLIIDDRKIEMKLIIVFKMEKMERLRGKKNTVYKTRDRVDLVSGRVSCFSAMAPK